RDLERVQRLFDQHLAANDQLGAARKTLADARAALASLLAAGGGHGRQTLTAPFAGVVGTVPTAVGDHVAADAPILTVIGAGGLIAQLGVEPARAAKVAPGQAVVIASAFDPARGAASRIAIVARQVDPATRLVTVSAPAAATGLPLGAAVQGTITVAGHPGLVVPRAAIVRDEAGAHVFVAKGGKARQTAVTLGLEQGEDIEVVRGVAAGEAVVVQGAYQLEDGMALRIAPR
ncbi:MAG: efflux RND transporter periplasmic adaptor subunit, partial [Pseudomonadota bacterium]